MTKEEFLRHVDTNGPIPEHVPGIGRCHVWTGFLKFGYGQTGSSVQGTRRAHVVAFYLEHGRRPEPCCLHRCDNRACVNPAHLFEGTKRDNTRDMLSKGRHRYVAHLGTKNGCAKLNEELVREIREASGSLNQIARRYGISFGLVWRVQKRLSWAHVP